MCSTTGRSKELPGPVKSTTTGPKEKKFSKKKVDLPDDSKNEQLDLSKLPEHISFKAASAREKITYQVILLIVGLIFCTHYYASKIEIASVYKKLREKEYILAPGVLDFTTASPQAVPDNYVKDAITDFLSDLGNVNPQSIDEQYNLLRRFMSDELRVKFDKDTESWVEQVKEDDISQLMTVKSKVIKSDNNGSFQVTARVKADFYIRQQYLGHENQVVEMLLKLVPPKKGKRWYLQIKELSWFKEDTYRKKQNLKGK